MVAAKKILALNNNFFSQMYSKKQQKKQHCLFRKIFLLFLFETIGT